MARGLRRSAVAVALVATMVVSVAGCGGGGDAPGSLKKATPAAAARRKADAQRRAAAGSRAAAALPFVAKAGTRGRGVALTFDDGPWPTTPKLLKVLKRLHVHATFFVVGTMVNARPAMLRAEERAGHVVADHTEDHANLSGRPQLQQAHELAQGAIAIRDATGHLPTLFRPPYGAFDATTIALLHSAGMTNVIWTIDSDHYDRPGVRAIVSRVLRQARTGSIVLMHDGGGDRTQTIAAVPFIVRGLRRRGLEPVTLPKLFDEAPPPTQQKLPFAAPS